MGRPTDGAGDGQVRQKMVGLDDLNLVGHEPDRSLTEAMTDIFWAPSAP